jgi:hypothetical protein
MVFKRNIATEFYPFELKQSGGGMAVFNQACFPLKRLLN